MAPGLRFGADAVAEWERAVGGLRAALEDAVDDHLDRFHTLPWARRPSPVSQLVWEAGIYETIHHGAEVGRMRHLYANRDTLGRDR